MAEDDHFSLTFREGLARRPPLLSGYAPTTQDTFLDKALDLSAIAARLHSFYGLSGDARTAFERLPLHKVSVVPGRDVVRADEQAKRCAIVLQGLAFGYKLTGDGQRQILGFYPAGDLPDLQSLHSDMIDTGVAAATACQIGYVAHDALRETCSSHPGLASVLWRELLCQAAIVREWLLNLGRRDARARLAHLLCEVVVRQRAVGLATDYSCAFPLTQALLADALGLSTVHVNRMVQDLRRENLIEWDGRQLRVLDWERLKAVADFDPTYLHLGRRPLTP